MQTRTIYFPILIFVLALSIRGIYYYQVKDIPLINHVPEAMDQTTYFKGAQAFANGNILAADPDISNHFSPLYQYFLGILFRLFGINLNVVWIAQLFLGTLSTLLIYAIGIHYFKPIVSFIAALLFTFYGVNWLYELTIYREPFITFLELMSCFLLIRFAKHPNLFWMTLSAVFLSLVTQSRTNFLLLVPFSFAFLWKKVFCMKSARKKLIIGYLTIFLFSSVPLLVWVQIVHGKWGFYDQTGPENLLISNTLSHDPRIYPHIEVYSKIIKDLPLETLPILGHIIKSAWEHPIAYLQFYLQKIYYYFNNYEVPNVYNFYLLQDFSPILKWCSIPFTLIGSLGITGFVLFRKHQQGWTLPHAYFIANLLMYLPFLVLSRYRLSIIPFLSLFSAYTLWAMFQKIRQQQWYSFSMVLICFICLIFIQRTDPLPSGKIRIVDYINTGSAFLNSANGEDDHRGYAYYKMAWDRYQILKPALPKAEKLLSLFSAYYAKEGEKYRQQNNLSKEIEAFKKAIFFDYSSSISHYNYSLALYNNRKYKKAFLETLQSIVINPNMHFLPHLLIGTIYNNYYHKPLWGLYHWQKAYDLMPDREKKNLSLKIKNLKNLINNQSPVFQTKSDNTFKNLKNILHNQIGPPVSFKTNMTLPDTIIEWSFIETEQYLVSLYKRLILFHDNNNAAIYYQIGMIYWKKMGKDFIALYYFRKAWSKGTQFKAFAEAINMLQKKQAAQAIY